MRIYLSFPLLLLACGDHTPATPDAPIDAALQTITIATPNALTGAIVAFRDGDGPWTAPTTTAPGGFQFAIAADRYSVVVACPDVNTVDVFDYTVAETTAVVDQLDCRNDPTVALSGTIANLGSESAYVAWYEYADIAADANGLYSFAGVPGAHDLVAVRYAGASLKRVADRLLVHHAVASSSPSTFELDFAGADATVLQPQAVTTTNLSAGDQLYAEAQLATSGGTYTDVLTASTTLPGALQLPSTLDAGDVLRVFLQLSNGRTFHSSVQFLGAPAALALDGLRDADLATVAPTADATGVELTASWKRQPAAQLYTLNVFQTNSWNVFVSPGFTNGADPITVTLPDLATVPNWQSGLDLVTGTAATYVLYGSSGGSLDVLANYLQPQAAGVTIEASGPYGSVRP